jgi:hypothetical protein
MKHIHKGNCKKYDLTNLTSIKTNQEHCFVTIKIKLTFDEQKIFSYIFYFVHFFFLIQLFFSPYIFVKEETHSMQ